MHRPRLHSWSVLAQTSQAAPPIPQAAIWPPGRHSSPTQHPEQLLGPHCSALGPHPVLKITAMKQVTEISRKLDLRLSGFTVPLLWALAA